MLAVVTHKLVCCTVMQVQLLVEEGGAELSTTDRWGASPLEEAKRVGAAAVAAYLSKPATKQAAVAAARNLAGIRSGSGSSRFGFNTAKGGWASSSAAIAEPADGGDS